MRKLIPLLALSAMFAAGVLLVVERPQSGRWSAAKEGSSPTGVKRSLPVLWPAPRFTGFDQSGKAVSSKVFEGHVWIADFIYTRCTSACPLLTAKLALLRRKIRAPDVRFVSFTVDPDYDTPPVLQQYARMWSGDPRWELIATSELPQVVSQMKVVVQHTSDKEDPITHSTSFFLGDRNGNVRGIYDSLDDESLKQLVQDVNAMEVAANPVGADADRSQPFAPIETAEGSVARGGELYNTIGCAACHSQVRIAPSLDGIAGRPVYLEDGGQVVADDTYLANSIFNPTLQVVSGYQALMPSYEGYVTPGQGRDLIAYIRSLHRGPGQGILAEPATPEAKVKDPVCGMEVVGSDRNAHLTYEGATYYFCSERCLEKFSKDPSRYDRANR